MKNTVIILISLFVSLSSLCACASSHSLPVMMDQFVDDAERYGDQYTFAQWTQSADEFNKLVTEYKSSSQQYTDAEREKAAKAIGRYHALLLKQGLSKSKEYFRYIGKVLPKYIDGFATELEKNSDNLVQSLQSLVDTTGLESSLERIGAALEKIFGDLDK